MKTISPVVVLPLLAFAASFFAGCRPEPIRLTAGNVRVVIAPDAPKTTQFAADEMTNFLSQVLGGPVPIGTEVEKRGGGGERWVNIVLGTNKWSMAAGLHPETLPRDSFVIKTIKSTVQRRPSAISLRSIATSNLQPGTIFIAGCDDPKWDIRKAWRQGHCGEIGSGFERATLFGVYDFLERYAGVRFYFPGPLGTIVPKKTALEIPVGTRSESPDFIKRMWYEPGALKLMEGDESGLPDRGRFGFLQLLRHRRFTGNPLVHGLRHMGYKQRFGKTHPEYFYATRTKDGKLVRHTDPKEKYTHLCWTSGILDEMYEDIVSYAKGEPPETRGVPCDPMFGKGVWPCLAFFDGLVQVSPDDGFSCCECDKCRAFYTGEDRSTQSSYASKYIWTKTMELARRLKANKIPVLIGQEAYSAYTKRPEGLDLPDNVVVGIVVPGPWSVRNPENHAKQMATVRDWYDHCGGAKVFLHNWALKCGKWDVPDLPCWSPESIGRFFAEVGPYSKGVYIESASDRFSHIYLNDYIIGKMTWNTKFDYQAAIDEHNRLMFGPAAPEMAEFFKDLEDCWVGKFTAGKMEYNALGPVPRTPTKVELWRTVYTAELMEKWRRLFETAAEKSKPKVEVEERTEKFHSSTWTSNFDSDLYARRIALLRRNLLEPVEKARAAFIADIDAEVEEARRKREGVRNLLDKEYSCDYFVPEKSASKDHEATPASSYKFIPFTFETNSVYRLSCFLETEDIKPELGYSFCGALVGIWSDVPQTWHFPLGNGAVTGSTAGRIHHALVLKTGKEFKSKGISIWLRGATGKMKVDGLILEKIK